MLTPVSRKAAYTDRLMCQRFAVSSCRYFARKWIVSSTATPMATLAVLARAIAGGGILLDQGIHLVDLLRLFAGLAAADGDRVVTCGDGEPIAGRVAYMAQQDLLMPWLTVIENVVIGSRLRGARPAYERARELLDSVGLADRGQILARDVGHRAVVEGNQVSGHVRSPHRGASAGGMLADRAGPNAPDLAQSPIFPRAPDLFIKS